MSRYYVVLLLLLTGCKTQKVEIPPTKNKITLEQLEKLSRLQKDKDYRPDEEIINKVARIRESSCSFEHTIEKLDHFYHIPDSALQVDDDPMTIQNTYFRSSYLISDCYRLLILITQQKSGGLTQFFIEDADKLYPGLAFKQGQRPKHDPNFRSFYKDRAEMVTDHTMLWKNFSRVDTVLSTYPSMRTGRKTKQFRLMHTLSPFYLAIGLYQKYDEWDDYYINPMTFQPELIWHDITLEGSERKFQLLVGGNEVSYPFYNSLTILDENGHRVRGEVIDALDLNPLMRELVNSADIENEAFWSDYMSVFWDHNDKALDNRFKDVILRR